MSDPYENARSELNVRTTNATTKQRPDNNEVTKPERPDGQRSERSSETDSNKDADGSSPDNGGREGTPDESELPKTT